MAGFYWEDHSQKKCSANPEILCVGHTCTVFSWLNDYYAYCGHEPKPEKNDLVHQPLNLGPGFVWRKQPGLHRLKEAHFPEE